MEEPPEQLGDLDWSDPEAVIAFCEAHRDWLEGHAGVTDQAEILWLIKAKVRYAAALVMKGDLAAALSNAEHAEALADRLDPSAAALHRAKEHAKYWIGTIRARRGEHLRAYRILRHLAGSDPIHDNVYDWLRYCWLGIWLTVSYHCVGTGIAVGTFLWFIELTPLSLSETNWWSLWGIAMGLIGTGVMGRGVTRRKLRRITSD